MNHWPSFAGRYGTRREALRLIAAYGGSFDAAFSALWGVPVEPVSLARRGDIVKYVDAEPHLGVCVGSSVAVLGEEGLLFAPISGCEVCWRIG
ncbi:MAG: hypothetical protein IT357_15390 [Gemmatimonadaceae bacterium]|nr:hypothetical protein [Gemmatimonadaceae bacterium]